MKSKAMQETFMKQAASSTGFLLGLLFNPEDRDDIFPRNIN
jgi:hypothetical protein